jgi:hypothetical protein
MKQGYSVSAHSAGEYTATLLVMVNAMKVGGRAPPTLTSLGKFYPHDGMYARKQPLLLCVLCGLYRTTRNTARVIEALHALQMKGRGENPYFQYRNIMFCLPIPTHIYVCICVRFLYF